MASRRFSSTFEIAQVGLKPPNLVAQLSGHFKMLLTDGVLQLQPQFRNIALENQAFVSFIGNFSQMFHLFLHLLDQRLELDGERIVTARASKPPAFFESVIGKTAGRTCFLRVVIYSLSRLSSGSAGEKLFDREGGIDRRPGNAFFIGARWTNMQREFLVADNLRDMKLRRIFFAYVANHRLVQSSDGTHFIFPIKLPRMPFPKEIILSPF